MSLQFQVNETGLNAQAGLGSLYIQPDHIGEGPQFSLVYFLLIFYQFVLEWTATCWRPTEQC